MSGRWISLLQKPSRWTIGPYIMVMSSTSPRLAHGASCGLYALRLTLEVLVAVSMCKIEWETIEKIIEQATKQEWNNTWKKILLQMKAEIFGK